MERLYYIAIALAAGVIGIVLFIIGYRKLVYPKGSGKFSRELWLSTMVIMALLTAVFCSKEELVRTTCYVHVIAEEKSLQDLQKMWSEFTAHKAEITEAKLRQAQSLLSRIQREQGFSAALSVATMWFLDTRVMHINRRFFIRADCYMSYANDMIKSLDDLETQYALLEKLSAEGKITPDALNKSKEAIKNACQKLIQDRGSKKAVMDDLSDDEKDRLVRFIMELSGIDPKQLKDGKPEEPKDKETK